MRRADLFSFDVECTPTLKISEQTTTKLNFLSQPAGDGDKSSCVWFNQHITFHSMEHPCFPGWRFESWFRFKAKPNAVAIAVLVAKNECIWDHPKESLALVRILFPDPFELL